MQASAASKGHSPQRGLKVTRREGRERGRYPKQQKAQGRNLKHRPPGFHACCAPQICARPNMRQDISVTLHPSCAIGWNNLRSQPDGAPLCPVAYPSHVSFLVTATTGGGASSPVELKFIALEDQCQGLCRFSSQDWQVLLRAHFATQFMRTFLAHV